MAEIHCLAPANLPENAAMVHFLPDSFTCVEVYPGDYCITRTMPHGRRSLWVKHHATYQEWCNVIRNLMKD